MLLTDSFINRAIVRELSVTFYQDDRLPCLRLRVSCKGASWYFHATIKGFRVRKSLGRYPNLSTDDALTMAWKLIAVSPPPTPITEKAANTTEEITFGVILSLYLEHKTLRPATIKGYTYFLEYTGFEVKSFREVTPESFLGWYREFAIHAPTQAKKVAGLIKVLARWYCQYINQPIIDPTIKVKTLLGVAIHASNSKDRKLEQHELPSFFNALSQLRQIREFVS